MIKAKKGLLIALFAAMMVFAFGATSAFAADKYITSDGAVWTNNFQTVTVNGDEYSATLEQGTNGMIHAYKHIVGGANYDAYFYDLTGAKLFDSAKNAVDASRTFASYYALLAKNKTLLIQTQKPSYFTDDWTVVKPAELQELTNYPAKVKTATKETAAKGDTIVIESTIKATNDATGAAGTPFLLGDDPTGTVTLTTGSTVASDGWYVDEAKAGNAFSDNNTYDGAEHTVLYYDADADKVTYEKKNKRTGEWEAVDTITFKDAVAAEDADQYRAQVTTTSVNGTTTTTSTSPVNPPLTLAIKKADKTPTFGFGMGNVEFSVDAKAYQLTAEQAADPSKFVEVTEKTFIAADEAELKAYFADEYDIAVKKDVVNGNVQVWTIERKDLKQKDVDAVNEKYETLIGNYNVTKDTTATDGEAFKVVKEKNQVRVLVTGAVDPNVNTDEINFTEAPNVTYKAKALKKKAKSFTVNAVAKSGNVVTYSIDSPSKKITIDSATGKVTVAKKLKKGTYKVIVKAHTEAGNGYKAAYAERELKIKVKK